MGKVNCRHVIAAEDRRTAVNRLFRKVKILRVLEYHNDRTETDDKRQDIEIPDETCRIENRFTCFFCIANGEKAHKDMRKTRSTEHQRHTE